MALAAGARLGPYEILEPVGAGGMGEVYRARDPRLKREVALKLLPPELASHPGRRERFEREAQALAALNHPNIVTIFSVEEAEGLHFLTMELVEGRTLTRAIPRGGLALSPFLQMAVPLAEAVSAAHERGITHRDLKPGNVMVTPEQGIKVLDFGLAKHHDPVESAADSEVPTATSAGRVLGTVAYMSPEQLQGQAADHRSDVFSLGIILYEMVTGDRPFAGETSAELASAILRDTPPSVTERKAALPRDLGRILKRCLEKEPRRRFQSVLDLRNELEELRKEIDTGEALASTGAPVPTRGGRKGRVWIGAAAVVAALGLAVGYLQTRSRPESPLPDTGSSDRRMLVVLPFENLGAPEDAYFAAGMTEEITSRLARVSGLGVISRSSAVRYEGTDKTIGQIGQELGVAYVLEGTVRWARQADAAGRVRITPQLIRVVDDTHLWAESYDRVLDDVFAVQAEIAEAVVGELGVALLPAERQDLANRPTNSVEAYQFYLRGIEHAGGLDFWSRESAEFQIRMFERAVERDPDFVEAHAALAGAHLNMWFVDRTPAWLDRAREAMDYALALDPDSPEAHVALGQYHLNAFGDHQRALREFDFAAQRRPNDSRIATSIASVRRAQGRFAEETAQFKRALELDPRNATIAFHLGDTYRFQRLYDEAERYYDLSIALAPNEMQGYRGRAENDLNRGLTAKARATLEGAPRSQNVFYYHVWLLLERQERNYQAALDRLAAMPADVLPQGWAGWKELEEAGLYRLLNRPEHARAASEAARVILEPAVKERPEDASLRGSLAQAYAGLGRKADAHREARTAVELLPLSKDAFWGVLPVFSKLWVSILLGEEDAAIDQIEYMLSIPCWVNVRGLRFDPRFDPLRDHPRFQRLLAEG